MDNNIKIKIGRHVPFLKEGQLVKSLEYFKNIGANSGGIYISDSRSYSSSYQLSKENIIEAREYAKTINFNLADIVVHSPLIGNIANTVDDSPTADLTVQAYIMDIKRIDSIGQIKYYNFHPGSSLDQENGINKCAQGINTVIEKTQDSKTILLIETMMTKGNYIGKNFEQIGKIISLVKNRNRIGVCIDTCHIWDGGYDIKNNLEGVLIQFDNHIGLKYLKALHINDSKNELGSGKDRHENIGEGKIGLEAIRKLIRHPKLKDLPKVIETPYGKESDYNIWKKEIELLK